MFSFVVIRFNNLAVHRLAVILVICVMVGVEVGKQIPRVVCK